MPREATITYDQVVRYAEAIKAEAGNRRHARFVTGMDREASALSTSFSNNGRARRLSPSRPH